MFTTNEVIFIIIAIIMSLALFTGVFFIVKQVMNGSTHSYRTSKKKQLAMIQYNRLANKLTSKEKEDAQVAMKSAIENLFRSYGSHSRRFTFHYSLSSNFKSQDAFIFAQAYFNCFEQYSDDCEDEFYFFELCPNIENRIK